MGATSLLVMALLITLGGPPVPASAASLVASTTKLTLASDGTGTVQVTIADGTTPTSVVDLWVDTTWQRSYTLTGGKAAIDLGAQPLGDHKITVRYRGDATTAASQDITAWTTPGTVQQTTTTTLAMNPDGTGTVTVTADGGATPQNFVDLYVDGTWLRAYALTGGKANVDIGTQALGDHIIKASYRASGATAASSAAVTWTAPGTVQVATTTALALNPDGTGTVTVTVADGSTPKNQVDLWVDNTWQRAYTLTNGTASIALGTQSSGDHVVTVRYRSSSLNAASQMTQAWTAPGTVQQATTTALTMNADGTGTVTVTVADGSTPHNYVDVYVDSTWQKAYVLTGGKVTIDIGSQSVGDHKVTARYRPSGANATSLATVTWTAPGTVQVSTTTTMSLNPDGTGTVTVKAADGSTPKNAVDLWVDSTWQRAYALTNGSVSIALGSQTLGDHKITAVYRASSLNAASQAVTVWTTPGTVQVPTTTTLALNADGSGTVDVAVADGSTPTSVVDMWIDGTWQRAYTLTNGHADLNVGTQPLGDHKVSVRYRGNSSSAPSSMSQTWTTPGTVQVPTTTTMTLNQDGTGTVTVSVADGTTPSNVVDLWLDGTFQRSLTLTAGSASFALGAQPGGDHQVVARYRGNSVSAPSQASQGWSVVTADQVATTAAVSILPDGTGSITVSAADGSATTDQVDMWVAGTLQKTYTLTNGTTTFDLGSRPGGDEQVSIRYRPSPTQLASTASTVWSVDTAPTPDPTACGPTVYKADGTAWTCTFADNFDGTSLDTSKWHVQTGVSNSNAAVCLVDSPSDVSVSDGSLHLSLQKQDPQQCGSDSTTSATYNAGMVSTWHAWSQEYGRIEARMKVSDTSIAGLHEAFWLWPDDRYPAGQGVWPANGEIDVAETYSAYPLLSVPFLHDDQDPLGSILSGADSNTSWGCQAARGVYNTYTLEWSPDRVEIFVNGQSCIVNTSGNDAFKKRYIIDLTQGIDPTSTSATDGVLPATTDVDYVRAWS